MFISSAIKLCMLNVALLQLWPVEVNKSLIIVEWKQAYTLYRNIAQPFRILNDT